MTTKTVIRSKMSLILLRCQQRLVEFLDWPEERVLIADPQDVGDQHPQGDAYLCLWVNAVSPNESVFIGAGRVDTRVSEPLGVCLRSRCGLDNAGEGISWLADKELGHLDLRHQVWDALIAFKPSDDGTEQGNFYLVEPMSPGPCTRPRRSQGAKADKDWGESTLNFTVIYELDLDQTYQ